MSLSLGTVSPLSNATASVLQKWNQNTKRMATDSKMESKHKTNGNRFKGWVVGKICKNVEILGDSAVGECRQFLCQIGTFIV
jgi:hypothetical protein